MDLTTTYLGLNLKSPLVAAASPLSRDLGSIRALEDGGAAAIVLHSLFEEQITRHQLDLDHFLSKDTDSFSEAVSFFPDLKNYNHGPDAYLEHLRKAKEAVKVPVIASLNGTTDAGWLDYARKLEQAGADALELNVYLVATNPAESSASVEQRYLDILSHVKKAVKIPVAMKLSPYFSAMANMAARLDQGGANGLVLFNRFYQPDIDVEALSVVPNVYLSTSASLRLPLRWVAILFGHVKADLAATSGVHTAVDVVKMMMAGASVTMMCSALLQHGPGHVRAVERDLLAWMEKHEYESIKQMRGSMSQRSCSDPLAFERANYMKSLTTYSAGSPTH